MSNLKALRVDYIGEIALDFDFMLRIKTARKVR